MRDAVASDARRDRGAVRGALDGIPIAVKDNLCRQGGVVTAGSNILQGWVAPYDATAVARLKHAGAVVVGSTNMDEFGMGSSTQHSAHHPTLHPMDVLRVPGGSSGGSAVAVRTGMAAGALGSDTGGSVRQPAALCGVVGFKPSYGRVSRFGLIAYASSLDVVGTIGVDVDSAALLYAAIAGVDARDQTSRAAAPASPRSPGVFGTRIGVPTRWLTRASVAVKGAHARAASALADAGAQLVEVDLPQCERAIACYYVIATAEASSNLARYDGVRFGPRDGEAGGLASMIESTRSRFGPEVKRRIILGTWLLSAGYYDKYVVRAQAVRAGITHELNSVLTLCDALLLPTSPETAWLRTDKPDALSEYLADIYTVPASLAGLPALSLPCGTDAGLPLAVQLVGPDGGDDDVLTLARELESLLM